MDYVLHFNSIELLRLFTGEFTDLAIIMFALWVVVYVKSMLQQSAMRMRFGVSIPYLIAMTPRGDGVLVKVRSPGCFGEDFHIGHPHVTICT